MRLLVLGGTVFLGRHFVEQALAAGHELTLFNRGRSNPDLFADRPGLTSIQGDRDGGLDALGDADWDAVIDPSGYLPRVVGASAELLADRCERYVFISTISVYAGFAPPGPDEDSTLAELEDEGTEVVDGETYGGLKVLCERAVESALPGRTLIPRPGLIVGPNDPTDRFSYWPLRVARGGEILAPGRPESPVQVIDVRDLCAWILRLVEGKATGIFNATGPATTMTLGGLLDSCREAIGSSCKVTWVDDPFIEEQGLSPFQDLPCWVPAAMEGMEQADLTRALAAGLTCRPLVETIRDTLAWRRPDMTSRPLKAGLSAERELELLAAWHDRD
jgi:2'-hydroxyisoflavone reductase